MKKLIYLLCCFCTIFASEEQVVAEKENAVEVRNAFTHVDLGLGPFPIPLPSFALGHRNQWGHHGFDTTFSVSTIVFATQLKASAAYLYYAKPNLKSQFYMGPGIGISSIPYTGSGYLGFSPEFIFGKEYTNEVGDRRFFQAQISFPTISGHGVSYFPWVILSYGICF